MTPTLVYRAKFTRQTDRRRFLRVSPMAREVAFDIEYTAESFESKEAFAALARMGNNREVIDALAVGPVQKAVPRGRWKPGHVRRLETYK